MAYMFLLFYLFYGLFKKKKENNTMSGFVLQLYMGTTYSCFNQSIQVNQITFPFVHRYPLAVSIVC